MEKCLSLTDVMVPLAEPLSSRSLIGEASTSVVPVAAEPVTTLSTTFVSSGVVVSLNLLSRTRKFGHSTMELRSLIS
ncbi:hypothetical protein Tco_1567216, partial [Tanacetum coccineum]